MYSVLSYQITQFIEKTHLLNASFDGTNDGRKEFFLINDKLHCFFDCFCYFFIYLIGIKTSHILKKIYNYVYKST